MGFPWLRTRSCQCSTRCHSSLRTSGSRRTQPCIIASRSAGRTGPAFGARLATPIPSHPGIGSPHAPDAGPRVPRLALPVSLGSGRCPPRTGATPGSTPGPGFPTSRGCDGSASNRCRHRRIAVHTCPRRRYSTRARADAGRGRECARASTARISSPAGTAHAPSVRSQQSSSSSGMSLETMLSSFTAAICSGGSGHFAALSTCVS